MTGWAALKAALLGYFKPADYAYKMRQALAKCSQHGTVTEYIMQFSEKYTQCSDVDWLKPCFGLSMVCNRQCRPGCVRSNPVDLQSAM